MRTTLSGIIGGLAGGLAMSLAMEAGRRTGILHKTLAEDAEDWIDRMTETRRYIGQHGTTAVEQANHLVAAAAFGTIYAIVRKRAPILPGWTMGALYGAGLYFTNIVGIAPRLGLTEGEHNASNMVRAERLGMHLLFGALTGLVAEKIARPAGRAACQR